MTGGKKVAAGSNSSDKTKKSRSGSPVVSVAASLAFFFTLLMVFDPDSKHATPANTAVHQHLKDFKGEVPGPDKNSDPNQQPIFSESLGGGDQNGGKDNDMLVKLLKEAKVYNTLTEEELASLPSWGQVEALYGSKPVIVGKERCELFRQQVPPERRILGPAGLFNTGTNLLEIHFIKNLRGIKRIYQVPWGKHRLPEVRMSHTAKDLTQYRKEDVLPVVIVRDPFAWMQSLCRTKYSTNWIHDESHCPNLVVSDHDRKKFPRLLRDRDDFNVRVKYDLHLPPRNFDSLAHIWTEFHNQYVDADYPVLFVRFEDVVFQPRAVLEQVADCVGAKIKEPLHYQVTSAKHHGSHSGFVKVVQKTANATYRLQNLTDADKLFAHEHLEPTLMDLFHYLDPVKTAVG